ncbi:hypothetical protein Ac2012v2_000550 [Leucoagaricus gongylophorus]
MTSLHHRQQSFLNGLASVMAKRNTPLPPSLTGVPSPGYDPASSPWSYIEPSSQIGSFRLANHDVSLFKLWGLAMQYGGAHALKANNAWPTICAEFNLPQDFSHVQPNGSTSVALMLEQMYTAILYPFEDLYKKNIQDQQRKAQIASRQLPIPQQIQRSIQRPRSAAINPPPDSNLLNNDIQPIKRKLDIDDPESKRTRQKTDPLDSAQSISDPPLQTTAQTRLRQPLRRKIEYIPWARQLETHGGRDLRTIDHEYNTISQKRPLRDINDWGMIDIEALRMSLCSNLPTELSYALTTLTIFSTMRGQSPGSGFPIFQCPDLFDDLLDLLEQLAFADLQDDFSAGALREITTHRQLVNIICDVQLEPFAALALHQGSKNHNAGPVPRPADIILTIINVLRNLSVVPDNWQFLSRHGRLVHVMLRTCTIRQVNGLPAPASDALSLSDLLQIRKDTLYTLVNLAPLIPLAPSSSYSATLSNRVLELVASYLIDPTEAVSPFVSVQIAGQHPTTPPPKPPSLADAALDVFTRFSHSDANRQILAQTIPETHIQRLFEALIHRLPLTDMDFQICGRETWLSYLEKTVMALYCLAFLSPPSLKHRLKADRKIGFRTVMFRLVHKSLSNPNPEMRSLFSLCCRRAVETMKVLDDEGDLFDTTETTAGTLSFGMGFADSSDNTIEIGSGLLVGRRDATWDILMTREVFGDECMFKELDSLARVECQ